MELRIYYYENLLSLKIRPFTKFLYYENLEPCGMPSGFREESEQEIKEAVKPTGNNYTWEELAKYNERHNVHVAVPFVEK